MCKKYHIGTKKYRHIINDQIPWEPTEEWCHVIESVKNLNGSTTKKEKVTIKKPPYTQIVSTPELFTMESSSITNISTVNSGYKNLVCAAEKCSYNQW